MRRALTVIVSLALLAGLSACAEPVTQMIVVAETDLTFPDQFSGIKVTAVGPEGTSEFATEDFETGDTPRPVTTSVYPLVGAYSPLSITVFAQGSDPAYPSRVIETAWIPEESLVLEVFLSASCQDVTCDDSTTCIDGACQSRIVDPETLPRWDGQDPTAR